MQTTENQPKQGMGAPAVMDIELLALDLNSCTRCVGTLDHIEEAISLIQPVMAVMSTQIHVNHILIESEEQASEYQFISSPTVRLNGKDIAVETLESACTSCTELCGCDEQTQCRLWRYRGEEYTEAPVGLIVEAILREIFEGSPDAIASTPEYTGAPENLQRFFRSKSETPPAETCCSAAEQQACCEPSEKSVCCDAAVPASCGCQ